MSTLSGHVSGHCVLISCYTVVKRGVDWYPDTKADIVTEYGAQGRRRAVSGHEGGHCVRIRRPGEA